MSIASEITRIQGAKANLKTAIEGKGVTVPSSTKLDGYAVLVDDIQTGGEPNLQDKSVSYTPTESQQTATVTADSEYDGLDEVSITVGAIDSEYVGSDVPRKSSANLTVSGATVNVPSGYYSASASKSVKSGTEGTPIASKGEVSNHSVDVTPIVTNTEGYIAGGKKSGTAVNVSASELVSGTKSITENGTEDVTNYASVNVNVPNSYDASDEGKVVDNGALVSQSSATYTENGTYDTTLVDDVTVNVSGGGGETELTTITLAEAVRSVTIDLTPYTISQYDYVEFVINASFVSLDWLYWNIDSTKLENNSEYYSSKTVNIKTRYRLEKIYSVSGVAGNTMLFAPPNDYFRGVHYINKPMQNISYMFFTGYSKDLQAGGTIKVYGGNYESL